MRFPGEVLVGSASARKRGGLFPLKSLKEDEMKKTQKLLGVTLTVAALLGMATVGGCAVSSGITLVGEEQGRCFC